MAHGMWRYRKAVILHGSLRDRIGRSNIIIHRGKSVKTAENPFLISCSILVKEIQMLIETSQLKANVTFLDAKLHYDYNLLEITLKKAIEIALGNGQKNTVVIYGDVCLGFNDEMKRLIDDYDISKVDALNCVDCLLGGGGQLLKTDPEHKYFFLTPEWITFWNKYEKPEENLKERYAMLDGIILLDSLGNIESYRDEVKVISKATGLPVLGKKKIGLNVLQKVIVDTINRPYNLK